MRLTSYKATEIKGKMFYVCIAGVVPPACVAYPKNSTPVEFLMRGPHRGPCWVDCSAWDVFFGGELTTAGRKYRDTEKQRL